MVHIPQIAAALWQLQLQVHQLTQATTTTMSSVISKSPSVEALVLVLQFHSVTSITINLQKDHVKTVNIISLHKSVTPLPFSHNLLLKKEKRTLIMVNLYNSVTSQPFSDSLESLKEIFLKSFLNLISALKLTQNHWLDSY